MKLNRRISVLVAVATILAGCGGGAASSTATPGIDHEQYRIEVRAALSKQSQPSQVCTAIEGLGASNAASYVDYQQRLVPTAAAIIAARQSSGAAPELWQADIMLQECARILP